MNEEINMLTNLSTEAVRIAVEEYAKWCFFDAVGWIIFAGIALCVAMNLWNKESDDQEIKVALKAVSVALGLISLVIIFANIPTCLSPKAAAIKSLLKDARG